LALRYAVGIADFGQHCTGFRIQFDLRCIQIEIENILSSIECKDEVHGAAS